MSETHDAICRTLVDVLQLDAEPGEALMVRRGDCEAWDSVNHLRLIMELEEQFDIALNDDAADASTVDELAACVESKLVETRDP